MSKNNLITIFIIFSMVLATACRGISSEETPESEPVDFEEEFTPFVSASGVVVPTS